MRTRSRPQLFVTDHGAGEPVLLITGWTISSAVFDPIADLFVPLRDGALRDGDTHLGHDDVDCGRAGH